LRDEAKDDQSEDLWTVNGTAIGHEVNNKNSFELDAAKLNVLNWGEMCKQRVDHNLTMLTLLSCYNLHCTGVERVVDVSKALAASIFSVVQEDLEASFFEDSAKRTPEHFENPNK